MNKPTDLTKQLRIIKIGNSAGVILPRDVLDRLQRGVGDALSLVDTPDGIALNAKDEQFEQHLAEARVIMKRYRKALGELAK